METLTRISIDEFKDVLAGFIGTENYYLHRLPGGLTMKLTDGCKFVKEYGNAYWLFDIILSWQMKLQNQSFQVWKLIKQGDGSWFIQCTDGNDQVVAAQEITYSIFPQDRLELWLVDGVCMLPSEY